MELGQDRPLLLQLLLQQILVCPASPTLPSAFFLSLLAELILVIATTATTTFTTTDGNGQVSVVTSFVVTAHNTPVFKSAANYYGALSGVFITGIVLGICALITLLWV
jgi:hypothetical protein